MTSLEEQVDNLAREWEAVAARVRGNDPVRDYLLRCAADLRALLPLEVTDEGVNVPKAALAQVMAIVRLTYPVRPESLAAEAIRQCNAALTQPQTERCPEDCDGFGRLIGDSDGPCPACSGLEPDRGGAATEKCPNPDCEGGTRPNGEGGWDMCPDCLEAANADGGGAAVAAGVADADLGLPLTNSTLVEEVIAAVYEACLDRAMDDPDAIEVAAVLRGQLTGTRTTTEPGPYAKAFRERVCPVPEFPGIEKEES